jgi:crossover junction endodeoxyribonuclease RuvC
MKTILGLDLSLTNTGYCVIQVDNGVAELLEKGSVKTTSKEILGKRLDKISTVLSHLIEKYPITEVVRERSFSNARIKSTQLIFMVNGACTMTLYRSGFPEVVEIAPTSVKKTISGNGRSEKEDLIAHIEKYIGKTSFKNLDESDSVAVALTYCIQRKYLKG